MQFRFSSTRWLLAAVLLLVSFLPQFPVQAQTEPPGGEVDAEAVLYSDPGAYFKVGSTAYAVTAADCDPLTDGGQACDNPLQAAVNFLAAQNLTPAGGKIYIGAGVYDLVGATNPASNWNIDGGGWTAYPPKLTLVGMGSALGSLETTTLKGHLSLTNLGSVTLSNILVQGGGIATANTTGLITLDRMQVMDSSGTCIWITNHQGSVAASQVLVNTCGASGNGFFADVSGGVKMAASHVNAAEGLGIYLSAGEAVTLLNVSSHLNATGGIVFQNQPDTAPNVTLTAVSATGNDGLGAQITTRGAVLVDRSTFAKNADTGLLVVNVEPESAPPVSILRSQWIRNSGGLKVQSAGRILVDGIRSESNEGGLTMSLDNMAGTQPIQISNRLGPNTLVNNASPSNIQSNSKISITGVNAVKSQGFQITAPNSSVTVARTSISASQSHPGLIVSSGGATTLSDVQVNYNNSIGAMLMPNGVGGPTRILRSQFNRNTGPGISISTLGRTQLSQVEASSNGSYGMQVESTGDAPTGWWVTVQQGVFDGNRGGYGLRVATAGGVQAKKVSASNNSAFGMRVEYPEPAPFQLTGKPGENRFMSNGDSGLAVLGVTKLAASGVEASQNGSFGVQAVGSTTQDFQFTNVQANANIGNGIYAVSGGRMLFKNVAADTNGDTGLIAQISYSDTAKLDLSILSSHFDGNSNYGMDLRTSGPVLLNGVSASHSVTSSGALISANGGAEVTAKVEILSTLGKNYFDDNGLLGLQVNNAQLFTASYLSARGNAKSSSAPGLFLRGPDAPVTMTCAVVTGNPADGLQAEIGAALFKIINGMIDGNTRLDPSSYANIRILDPATTLEYKPGVCSGW